MIESFIQGAMYGATVAAIVGLVATIAVPPVALVAAAAIGGVSKALNYRKPHYTFRR